MYNPAAFFLSLFVVSLLFLNQISNIYSIDRTEREVRITREYTDRHPRPSVSSTPSATPITSPAAIPIPPPIPTIAPKPTLTPSPSSESNDIQAYIMSAINNYRRLKGLPAVQTDPYTCAFAKIRSQEITTNFTHDGFRSRGETGTLPYPSYQYVTENLAYTGDYRRVVYLWINSSGHAANLEANTPYVCVETTGNYYAYEGWRP